MQIGIGKEREDIFKQDALGWEVGELANGLLQSYLKTGEFGGGGGIGGGESERGGFC